MSYYLNVKTATKILPIANDVILLFSMDAVGM